MDYRGVLIEHDLFGSGWCFFDKASRTKVCAAQIEVIYHEIDAILDTPDGAD